MDWLRKLKSSVRARIKRRYVSRGLIIIYHRVAEDIVDPWGLCVSPANFARHMEVIREVGLRPVHVSDMAQALRAGRLSRRTIAITFDDGYVDNLDAARPNLERYDIPAVHFATAGYIGSNEPFWWDVLDIVFLRTKQLPETFNVKLGGEDRRWTLGRESVLKKAPDTAGWKPLGLPHTRRQEIHDSVWRLLAEAMPEERREVVRHLIDWAEVPSKTWENARPMSDEELRGLRGDGLVEIGAHSLTHPALSAMPTPIQRHELGASKVRLEEILGVKVRGCAYPLGRSSPDLGDLARDIGYDFACGTSKRAVDSRSDLFQLPRASVKNWESEQFKSLLGHHLAI